MKSSESVTVEIKRFFFFKMLQEVNCISLENCTVYVQCSSPVICTLSLSLNYFYNFESVDN